jgi:Uma2 family endonuclease
MRSTRRPATIEDLYKVEDKAELVDGRIVVLPPMGFSPGRACLAIALKLFPYEQQAGIGRTLPGRCGFVVDLPHRKSFCPDLAFHLSGRPQEVDLKFVEGAPTFAVEMRRTHDYGTAAERRMAAKRADYFAAGTQVVWDVDLLSDDVVRVYKADNPTEPTIYRRGEEAEAEPALPGWRMQVDDLFR